MAKPKTRIARTDIELKLKSNQLYYEWQMLAGLAQILQTPLDDRLLKNAIIDSCAIHARAIAKFLFAYHLLGQKEKPQNTDVIAEDFLLDSGKWSKDAPLPPELEYETFGIFADKQIAHIVYTSDRGNHPINQGHHNWDFNAIADAIQPILEKFINLVPVEKLGDRWINRENYQSGPRWQKLKEIMEIKTSQ